MDGTVAGGVITVGSGGGGGAGGRGAGGTVTVGGKGTVGRVTVGGGGSCPALVPAQAPSRPRTRRVGSRTGIDRFRICGCNGERRRVVSVRPPARKKRGVARDLYEVLGVRRDADLDAIKQAYRRLARRLHPDVAEDGSEHFHEVTEAFAILSDDRSRRLYDRFGWRGRGSGLAPRRGMARVYASDPRAFLEDLESVIEAAAGRRPEKEPTRVVGEVEVDAYEARLGATRSVDRGEALPCAACEGAGRRKVVSQRESGRFLSLEYCPDCRGTGRFGSGRPVEVIVPPRTRELDRLSLGPEEVAIVRIVPPREKVAIRLAASAGLLAAVGFLLFLLAL